MVTLTERTIMKSRSGVYSDTAENRRKHRVGQKYGAEKQPEDGEKTEKKEADPAKELEAVNKVIAAINEGKLNLPAAEVIKLSEKKQKLEAAKKQAEKINAGVKANEEKKNAEEAKETSKKINEAQKKESEKKEKPADELASAREELQRHKDKKDSWIAKYGKNSYETRLEQIKDNVERLKNKTRSEKEKKTDEKSSKKAAEMKEKLKQAESDEQLAQDNSRIFQEKIHKFFSDKKKEGFTNLGKGNLGKVIGWKNGKLEVEYARFGEENWTSEVQRGSDDFKALEEEGKVPKETKTSGDEKGEKSARGKEAQKPDTKGGENEENETFTRVKFDDVPNSGKINLKKYLSEKVRTGVDEKWSNIKKIPTENLKKMEKGLVNDLNKNFEAIKKSQRAELLYSIMKVRGELESRGKETSKRGDKESGKLSDLQSKVPGYMSMPEYKKYISAKSEVDNFGKVPSGGDKRQRYDELNEQLVEVTKKYKEALKKKLTT